MTSFEQEYHDALVEQETVRNQAWAIEGGSLREVLEQLHQQGGPMSQLRSNFAVVRESLRITDDYEITNGQAVALFDDERLEAATRAITEAQEGFDADRELLFDAVETSIERGTEFSREAWQHLVLLDADGRASERLGDVWEHGMDGKALLELAEWPTRRAVDLAREVKDQSEPDLGRFFTKQDPRREPSRGMEHVSMPLQRLVSEQLDQRGEQKAAPSGPEF